jgi:hypothetical protein
VCVCVRAPFKMGPICCPETSAGNYQSTLRNIPDSEGLTNVATELFKSLKNLPVAFRLFMKKFSVTYLRFVQNISECVSRFVAT